MRKQITIAVGFVLALSGSASAAELHVLTVGAVQYALKAIAADYAKESGDTVAFDVGSPAQVVQKLAAGERADILIMAEPAMDDFAKSGGLRQGTRQKLARTGLGVAIRAGTPVPNLASADGFKAAILAARSIAYGDPSIPNQSGAQAAAVLESAGLLDQVKDKTRIAGLGPGLEAIAKGDIELGLFNVSEIKPAEGKGATLAGPVPPPYQRYLAYDAAVMTDAKAPEEARRFIAYLTGADARWRQAALEPLGSETQHEGDAK